MRGPLLPPPPSHPRRLTTASLLAAAAAAVLTAVLVLAVPAATGTLHRAAAVGPLAARPPVAPAAPRHVLRSPDVPAKPSVVRPTGRVPWRAPSVAPPRDALSLGGLNSVLLASAAVAAVWLTFFRPTSRTLIQLPAASWTAAASSGVPAIDDALRNRPPPPRNALRWSWQQTMLRVKDPTRSLGFYRGLLGFTLLDRIDFPALRFSLYFLATLPPDEPYTLTPGTDEAHRFLWTFKGVTLELTHNWGTELRPDFGYHPGNAPGDGFGHVAVSCEDVEARCTELAAGVRFQKKPNEGRMKGLAFALDPDGYWVEVVRRPPNANAGKYAFAQTMLRVRDPRLTIPFYERLGLSLMLVRHLGDFSLYFMANLPPDGPPPPDPYGDDAPAFIASLPGPVLEFTHNHGTEDQEGFIHDNGNTRGRQGRAVIQFQFTHS